MLMSAVKEAVGKASREYGFVVKQEGSAAPVNVKVLCWLSRAAKEQSRMVAKANANNVLFSAGCKFLRMDLPLVFLVFNSIRKRLY